MELGNTSTASCCVHGIYIFLNAACSRCGVFFPTGGFPLFFFSLSPGGKQKPRKSHLNNRTPIKKLFKKKTKTQNSWWCVVFFVEFCFWACQLCVNETFKNTGKAILEHSFEPPLIFTDLVSKERKHELYIGKLYSISQRGSQSYSKWFDDLNESTVHRIQEWMHFHSTIHFYYQHCSITKF